MATGGKMELVAVGCRFVLGVVFLLAGLAKLPRLRDFEATVGGYGLLPTRWVPTVARSIPTVELVIGALLLAGFETRWVALATASVLVVFSAAVVVNLARGRELDCGCFAVGAPRRIGWLLVARNIVLVALSIVAVVSVPRVLGLDELIGGGSSGVGDGDAIALLIAAAALVIGAAVVAEALQLRDRQRTFMRGVEAPGT
jgi:uncharacterized membrane protein YphA (DoxX/SURF4 family)